ncbi:MAG: hypothetical protein LRY27_02240 [Chitinophagales bacterium]|nr:hypothetical protein [Chitinophagales bacterium]
MGKDILQSILQEFLPNTKEQWEKQAEKDLKGVPLSKLNWKINEELEQFAYANEEDVQGFDTSVLKNNNPDWQIAAHYAQNENKEILADLQMGLTAPIIDITEDADFYSIYKDVQTPYIFNHFKAKSAYADLFSKWKTFLTEHNYEEEITPTFFHFNASYYSSALQKEWQELVLKNKNKQWKTICIDAQKHYNGKENIVEELKKCL